ncbi:peptidoglycan DD-metalloendopeptidase family protein [Desulfofarcimen acetoxidans]|nr:peptidoglycan DD-metalloendopeptidase family protein [Desulfofarcimen acetoxidans]
MVIIPLPTLDSILQDRSKNYHYFINRFYIATAIKLSKIIANKKRRKRLITASVAIVIIVLFFVSMIFMVISTVTGMIGVSTGFRSGAPTGMAKSVIPADLMQIFLKAQEKYDVSWAVLAAVCKVETDFGRNMSTSSAGAMGFMQFMPATWQQYKQDGDGDGVYDPENPWDAIFAAANMLKADGYKDNPSQALYCYNHAWWYVNKVLTIASSFSDTMVPTGNGAWPVPGYITISSPFTLSRLHPILGYKRPHEGIDIDAPTGTPVIAAVSGKVKLAKPNGGYGNCIEITGDFCMNIYGHLSGYAVHAGDYVSQGQVIGYVGSTGLSTGPHLHFGVYVNNSPCNPEEWLRIPSANY